MLEFLATACATIFAGAAIYISVVQHPAALDAGTEIARALFRPMYRRAAPMQAGLAVVGSLAGLLAWLSGSGWPWLIGALLLGSVVPFTLLRIKPVNDQLLGLDADVPDASTLLRRWGRLHWVRSGCGAAGALLYLLGWAAA